MKPSIIAAVLLAVFPIGAQEPVSNPVFKLPHFLAHAHSHNDYEQKQPLLDAVATGVTSIEIDLFLDGDALRVAHDRGKWRGEFETLYLQPLNELWVRNALPKSDAGAFLVWLDLKENSTALRAALHRALQTYPVTSRIDPARARVQVILTGNEDAKRTFVREYPSELVTRDSNIFLDDDPDGSPEWSWYALDWTKIGRWNGEGIMPSHERELLTGLVARIDAKHRSVRLWKHPATAAFWEAALKAGVDLLGTDVLPKRHSTSGTQHDKR